MFESVAAGQGSEQGLQPVEVKVPSTGGITKCVGDEAEVADLLNEIGDGALHRHGGQAPGEGYVVRLQFAPSITDLRSLALAAARGDELVAICPEVADL